MYTYVNEGEQNSKTSCAIETNDQFLFFFKSVNIKSYFKIDLKSTSMSYIYISFLATPVFGLAKKTLPKLELGAWSPGADDVSKDLLFYREAMVIIYNMVSFSI